MDRMMEDSFTVAAEHMWVTIIYILSLASYFTSFATTDKLDFGM